MSKNVRKIALETLKMNIFQKFLLHSCSAHQDGSNEIRIFNFYPRESGEMQKSHFTLNQGRKIFFEKTVNVKSLTSLGRTSPPNFIDFKK
jgi:hypothetical protein